MPAGFHLAEKELVKELMIKVKTLSVFIGKLNIEKRIAEND